MNPMSASRADTVGQGLAFALGVSTFLPIGMQYAVLLAFAALAVSSRSWRTRRTPIPRAWLVLLLAFVLWPGLTLAFHWLDGGVARWLNSWRVAGCLLLGLTLSARESERLLLGLGVGTLAAVAVVLCHELIVPLPASTIWNALLSVQGNASSQKWIVLAAASGVAFSMALYDRAGMATRTAWVAGGLLLAGVVMAFSISRNAYVVALTMPLLAVAHRFRSYRLWLLTLLIIVMVAAALPLLSQNVAQRLLLGWHDWQAFLESGNFTGSVGVRAKMSGVALQNFLAHPLIGTGLGSWVPIWAEAAASEPEMAVHNNPHNDYLLWAMETGLPGLLLMVLVLLGLAGAAWRRRQRPGALAWTLSWTLILSCALNAPLRDAALGMALIVLSAGLLNARSVPDAHGTPAPAIDSR